MKVFHPSIIRSLLFFGIALVWSDYGIAQNWAPIDQDKTYYYRADTANRITHQIEVDSVVSVNSNQAFYLNRIVEKCDTCSAESLPAYSEVDTTYYNINHPQFLQGRITDSSGIYHFQNPQHFKINANKPIDSSWTFDADSNIMAVIDSVYSRSLYGTMDSVKRIQLSNNKSILLSKHHGILKFPAIYNNIGYHMTGLSSDTSSKGETLPGFYEIFDFNEGDVFQYIIHSYYGPKSKTNSWLKRTIKSKEITKDTIKYKAKIRSLKFAYSYESDRSEMRDLRFVASANHSANCYPQQVIMTDSFRFFRKVYEDSLATDCHITLDSNKRITKTFGQEIRVTQYRNYYYRHGYFKQVSGNIFQKYGSPGFNFSKQFKEGLGLTRLKRSFSGSQDYDYEKQLIGYVKNGDTTGTILSNEELKTSSMENIQAKNRVLKIFPNPVHARLQVKSLIKGEPMIVRMHNNLGKKVFTKKADASTIKIDMTPFKNGIYFLIIRQGNKVTRRKVVKH